MAAEVDDRRIAELSGPERAAVLLLVLGDEHGAPIWTSLDDDELRILQLDTVSKEALDQIEESLRTNFIANLSQTSRRDAHDLLAEIFNSFDRQNESKFMEALEGVAFKSAERIRALMFTFEDITKLDANSAQVLIRNIDKTDLAKALKGASVPTREYFTSKMTTRAATVFTDEMQGLGPIRLKEVDEAQQRIIAVAKSLADKGEIIISKGGNDDDMILE